MESPFLIQCLPEAVFEVIAEYLDGYDLNSCCNVCVSWKQYFNKNKIWKKCCMYPETYYKHFVGSYGNDHTEKNIKCMWRQYFEYQQNVHDNWTKGKYVIEKSNILLSQINFLYFNIDDEGKQWLFDINNNKLAVYKFMNSPIFHQQVDEPDSMEQICPLKDIILICRSNFVKVFDFRPPHYKLELQYRFKFEMEEVLPADEVIPADDYSPGVRFICAGYLLVGCNENITDIHKPLLHFWNLTSAKKIATKSVYQQTFDEYVFLKSGSIINSSFTGGILLSEGNEKEFLITLIDDRFKLCQVTLYDVSTLSYSNVIAQFESRTCWCSMKGDLIIIFHFKDNISQISVYDVRGDFLAKLDFPASYNPMLSDEFWFSGTQIFLIVDEKMEVLAISSYNKVSRHSFTIGKHKGILAYYFPQFLLLYNKLARDSVCGAQLVTVWDVDLGVKLWTFPELSITYNCNNVLKNTKFPRRLLLNFKDELELCVMNFEKKCI